MSRLCLEWARRHFKREENMVERRARLRWREGVNRARTAGVESGETDGG